MTLQEAIHTTEHELPLYLSNPQTPLMHALKLLIEAGKRVTYQRKDHLSRYSELLPGETKD